jgi:hypothetical protein
LAEGLCNLDGHAPARRQGEGAIARSKEIGLVSPGETKNNAVVHQGNRVKDFMVR